MPFFSAFSKTRQSRGLAGIDRTFRRAALQDFRHLRHRFQCLMLGCRRRESADVRGRYDFGMAGKRL
jgi:hypothetical protein